MILYRQIRRLYLWAKLFLTIFQQAWLALLGSLQVEPMRLQARFLAAKFGQGHGKSFIDDALVLDRQALELCPPGHPKRPVSLTWVAAHLWDRYNQLGDVADLTEAIALAREALDLCPPWHTDRVVSLKTLGVCLCTRYERLGALQDLREAIALYREALQLCPPGHLDRAMTLNNLAVCLSHRYQQLCGLEDLDEALMLDREALDLRPRGHPDRLMSLNNLGIRLATRHRQLGTTEDLDHAITLGREALDLSPPGHPHRARSLGNLAHRLVARYKQLRVTLDLNQAIVLFREAPELCSEGHPDHSWSMHNLAFCLLTRYTNPELSSMADLDESIVLTREAVNLHSRGGPLLSSSLNNLADALLARYKQHGAVKDLEEAIALDRQALGLRLEGHHERSTSLNNLAFHLSVRYNQLGAAEDLNEAILLTRDALALRPPGHPDRSQSLENLAGYLYTQFLKSGLEQDKEALLSLHAQIVDVSLSPMVTTGDLSAARTWIGMAEDFHHHSTTLVYEASLRILVKQLATLPSLPQHLGILKALASSLAVDAFSACLRHHAPARAVELLEQGRTVFWSQMARLRSPLDDVIASGPAGVTLTHQFTQLAALIRGVLDSSGANQHERMCHLNVELQRVMSAIRELPGLSRFLLPALFSDLQRAACEGPIIIVSASKYTCDALVISLDQAPVHIPLRITQGRVRDLSKEVRELTTSSNLRKGDVTKPLAMILRELWNLVVSPIVDILQTSLPPRSRIWWCPIAEFSVLPLHAAGPFRKGQLNLSDLYVSSYTPTLTALIRARQNNPLSPASPGTQKRFVAIGHPKADGEKELLSVGTELANIGQLVNGLATFTCISDPESCISRVAEELSKNEWVHLACHGLPDQKEPFESAFALHDGHFTIQRIIQCQPVDPQFAYLSACHTTVGDEESADEVIHLAAAMHFAGFRSVIGSMWGVDDGMTNKITSTFYKHMVDESGRLDHTRAAYALNETMNSVILPLDQRVVYIHLGA